MFPRWSTLFLSTVLITKCRIIRNGFYSQWAAKMIHTCENTWMHPPTHLCIFCIFYLPTTTQVGSALPRHGRENDLSAVCLITVMWSWKRVLGTAAQHCPTLPSPQVCWEVQKTTCPRAPQTQQEGRRGDALVFRQSWQNTTCRTVTAQ